MIGLVTCQATIKHVRDFKEMDRLPMASGFSAIQNISGLPQGPVSLSMARRMGNGLGRRGQG
jgi:hypothetical protein